MAIRAGVGVMMMISLLFIGTFAISESAQQNQPTNSTEAEQAGQMAEGVFEGVLGGAGQGMVWAGISAIILVALGLLVAAYAGGGR